MKQCFGYIRVSTAKQGEGVSLEAQREAIAAFAAANQIVITKWFEEKETAAKSGRPIFNGMVRALRKGAAEGVVIHKIDRSARNFRDWAQVGELSDAGIDVHFAAESLDFRSRGGRLSADIQAVIAADYIRNLREETIKGINGRLKQGLYPFKAPIGYLDNGGGEPKTPDLARAPLIGEMFELYASGQHSLRSLRREMAKRGLRNDNGQPLSKCGIETVLGNPFYCGLIKIKRTGVTYQGIHEPIVSASLFEAVQRVRAGKGGKKVTKHNHTYRGLFQCDLCSKSMIPERQKGHVYYRCQTPDCATKCVREEVIESAVDQVLTRVQLSPENAEWLVEELERWWDKHQAKEQPNTLPAELAKIDARLERLTDALIDRLIDDEAFAKRKERLLIEQTRLTEQAKKTVRATPSRAQVRQFLERLKSLAVTYVIALPGEKRQIVRLATSNRTVVGKEVRVEPSDWLIAAEQALVGLIGPPYRTTSRRRRHLTDMHVERLSAVASAPETQQLESLNQDTEIR